MDSKTEMQTLPTQPPHKPPPNDSIFTLFSNALGSLSSLPNWKLALLSSIFLAVILSFAKFRKSLFLNREISGTFTFYALLTTKQFFIVHSFIFRNVFPYKPDALSYLVFIVSLFVIEFFKREFIVEKEIRLAEDKLLLDKLFKDREYLKSYTLFLRTQLYLIKSENAKIDESGKTYSMKDNILTAFKASFANEEDKEGRIEIISTVLFGGDYEKAGIFFEEYKGIIMQLEQEQIEKNCELLIKLKELNGALKEAMNILPDLKDSNLDNSLLNLLYERIRSFSQMIPNGCTHNTFEDPFEDALEDPSEDPFEDPFERLIFSIEHKKALNEAYDTLIPKIKDFNKKDMDKINEESHILPLIKSINAMILNIKPWEKHD